MRGTPAEARVAAKTGTLQRVNALAGYVTTERGERLAFAIMVNNQVELSTTAKAAIDDIAIVLATTR